MFRGTGHFTTITPVPHFLLAWLVAAVLIGNGMTLVGFTTRIPGRPAAASPTPDARATPAPVPPPVAPRPTSRPQPRPRGDRPEVGPRQWPTGLPDPDDVERDRRGPSPFARRCADGSIPAQWCHGIPG